MNKSFFVPSFLPLYIKKHSCPQVTRLLRHFLCKKIVDFQDYL